MREYEISVDISWYPLQAEYKGPIRRFIRALQAHDELKVVPGGMGTQVFGPYERTLALICQAMAEAQREIPHSAFILKVVGSDRSGSPSL